MGRGFEVEVGSIQPQRDEYVVPPDRKVPDTEFWSGTQEAKDVGHFKRFVCQLEITQDGESDSAEVIVSTRGRIVMVTEPEGLDVSAQNVFSAIHKVATRFDYADVATDYYPKGHTGTPVAPVPIDDQSVRDKHYSVTGDPYWLVDVLHHLRDAGGFSSEGRIPV